MEHRSYRPDKRPDIEVLIDGVWHVGEPRGWSQLEDGSWVGNLQWRPLDQTTRRLGTFPAGVIRPAPDLTAGAKRLAT